MEVFFFCWLWEMAAAASTDVKYVLNLKKKANYFFDQPFNGPVESYDFNWGHPPHQHNVLDQRRLSSSHG